MKHQAKAGWIIKPQGNGSTVYETDCVGRLSGVRDEKKRKLAEAGITQMYQLAAIGNTNGK